MLQGPGLAKRGLILVVTFLDCFSTIWGLGSGGAVTVQGISKQKTGGIPSILYCIFIMVGMLNVQGSTVL